MTAWLDISLEPGACSGLLLAWRDGGKQPSTRSVTFQHSGLSNWFEEPDDKRESLHLLRELQVKHRRVVLSNISNVFVVEKNRPKFHLNKTPILIHSCQHKFLKLISDSGTDENDSSNFNLLIFEISSFVGGKVSRRCSFRSMNVF